MNLQKKIKHINKKLTKYSRVLFVLLSATGIILSFFISNVSQFKVNQADTLTGTAVSGLFTNGVNKLITLKNGSDQMLTYTNQWGDPYVQINTHYNAANYNDFNVCNTDVEFGSLISRESIATDYVGNTYIMDDINNQLEIYPYDDCTLYSYTVTATAEATYAMAFDNNTSSVYAAKENRLLRFDSSDFSITNEVSYDFFRNSPKSIVVNETDGLVYILFTDALQVYEYSSNSIISEIDLLAENISCGQYIRMEGSTIYISDECDNGIYQFNTSFTNQNYYQFDETIRDFKVNTNHIFISSSYYVTKFNKNNPSSPTVSNLLSDVDFVSIDLLGDNVMNLASWYREVYQFDLTITGGGSCSVVTPPYILSGNLCQRFIYDSTEFNSHPTYLNSESIYFDGRTIVLQNRGGFDSGLWIDLDGYHDFPSNLHYPMQLVAGPNTNGVYILFQVDDNTSSEPVIGFYEFGANTVTATYGFPGGSDNPQDFVIDADGNIIVLNHTYPSSTSLTIFPTGDYANPYTINPDFNFDSSGYLVIEIDANKNLYVVGGDGGADTLELRVVEYNSGAYDTSSSIDLDGFDFYALGDLEVEAADLGLVDVYISGSSDSSISKVQKITDVALDGTYNLSSAMLTGYGEFGSYFIDDITVDNNGNVFAVPSQSSDTVAWFTPDEVLHEIILNDTDGYIVDVIIDELNNLYVTSEGINYQLFLYDFETITGGGDVCPVATPPYIFNNTRCERYVFDADLSNTTSVEMGEYFVETAMDNDNFFATTDSNRLYAVNNFWTLPDGYNNIYRLKPDPSSTVGVNFITDGPGSYLRVMHYDYDTQTFDFAYNTQSTLGNIDYDFDSNGDLYVLGHSFGSTVLLKFANEDYEGGEIVSLDFTFPGSCSPRMEINDTDGLIAACGSNIRTMNAGDYGNSVNYDMSSDGMDSNGFTDMVVEETPGSEVNIYFSGTHFSSFSGLVQAYSGFTTAGTYNTLTDYTADAIFNFIPINDITVGNNGSIFASSGNLSTQMVRFIPDGLGTYEEIDAVDHGQIVDTVLDSEYNLYLTSQTLAYQYYEFNFIAPSFAGTNACVVGGNIDPNMFAQGSSVNATGYVDGDPDPFPFVSPTGYMEIRANGLPVATAPLDGSANINYDFLINTPGIYTMSYFYPGDENYAGCASNIESVTVTALNVGGVESVLDVVSFNPSNNRQIAGEDFFITFHARDPNDNLAILTGDVEFRRYDNTVIETLTLDGSGNVVFNTKNLRAGNYGAYGYYLGDTTYSASSSYAFNFTIFSIGTRVTLESSQNPVVEGDSFTLTAHVEYQNFVPSVSSPVEKSGWVRFRTSNNTFIGEGLIDLNGDVSITVNTSDLPPDFLNLNSGIHHLRAYYTPDHEERNLNLRRSNSETLFQSVTETGSGGGSDTGSDIPPSGGEGGNSDFSAVITGKDKATGSLTQTKIGSLLSWIMSYNNLGPNSNDAVTYFPIRENQDFVVDSVVAPVSWTITYSQDQGCDDSTFTYTPVGAPGATDTLVRCVRFENERLNVPPTRSDVRYITTSTNFGELNVGALGGTDVYKVVPDLENNRLYYFNHHFTAHRADWAGGKSFFCFDLELNDTCVSSNPDIVYPVWIGLDGWNDVDDEILSSETGFAVNAEIVDDKMYIPMTNVFYNDGLGSGHGLLCWDLATDFYCSGPSFKNGIVIFDDTAVGAWGWGNIGDVDYNPDLQELYVSAVGPDNGYMVMYCYSTALNTPCPGQPYSWGTVQGYDIGWVINIYQPSTDRIYASGGGTTVTLDRKISCMIATTKELCSDFPPEGVTIINTKRDQSVFINSYNDEMCVVMYSDGDNSDFTPPAMYCYDLDTESFYNFLPSMSDMLLTDWSNMDFNGPYPDGRFYMKTRWPGSWAVYCFDFNTKEQCAGWEGGKTSAPFDDKIYTMNEAFGCMWAASDSGRVFTFDGVTGEVCNPLITLSQGNVAVTLDANDMFCAMSPDDISWNKVKVLDSGTSPSPALLNATVYDSANCTTNNNNIVTCAGAPIKSGNLLLNSGHELDISDIDYNVHKSLTAILEFAYPAVPDPAPGFYIELNPTNKAQMCAETKLLFSGALCANPITTVCENTNINYINDPVSNNNGGQYCLNVETYFGKDPNSALCFVAATPEQRIFTVFNPNATLAPDGTQIPFDPEDTYNRGPGNYSFGNGFFGFFENIIETTIPQIVNEENVRNVANSINTQTPLAVTAVTAITTATVVATSVFAAGSGIGQVFGVLLGFFTAKRKKYWGIIFDDFTNKPIAFASITLSSKEIGNDNQMKSNVITQAVSDLNGRYRLNTDRRDKFYLEVKASGYQPYTKFVSMANPLNSAEDIVFDIPLRRLDSKSNFFKTLLSYRKKGLINFARSVLLISSVFGFIFTIYSQINFANNLNIILIAVYVIIFIISFYPSVYSRIQKRGKVIDVDFNSPIPGAVVRIYDTKQQIALSLTTARGEARFDLPAGEYSILASKRGYVMVAEQGKQLIKATLKKEGYLDKNILLKRIEEAPMQSTTGLDNPFT